MAWMHVEKKLELFLLVWCRLHVARQTCTIFQGAYLICLINPIYGKYSLHVGNLILMISGVNALSLGLLVNVICDRFRLAWFVTQAL